MIQRIPSQFRPDTALVECLAAYVGRRQDLSPARRLELSQIIGRHFIQTWSLPPKINTDHLLCAIYEFATMDEEHRSVRREQELDEVVDAKEAAVTSHLRSLEEVFHEGR